jgi:hypothetical protein
VADDHCVIERIEMNGSKSFAIGLVLLLMAGETGRAVDVEVRTTAELRRALGEARAGDRIRLAAGRFDGGLYVEGRSGEPGRPIVIEGVDREHPPEIHGGGNGLHLAGVSHVELRDLVFVGATGNGVNIDDAGERARPATDVVVERVVVRDVGPRGNRDGIKMSGVDRFRVVDCVVERWGDEGSGIDMVGCHDGRIERCVFRHRAGEGGNGVQAKGGSSNVVVASCRFEDAGQRAVNIGGSTGTEFFRPPGATYESKDVTVEGCTIIGSAAAVAFVGVDGSTVRRNVIYRPRRWAFRILQENTGDGMAPSRNGRFERNIVAFRREELQTAVNVGPNTAPKTFAMVGNAWYCLDMPDRSRPESVIEEVDALYGKNPQFRDEEKLDLRLREDSPLRDRIPPGDAAPGSPTTSLQ